MVHSKIICGNQPTSGYNFDHYYYEIFRGNTTHINNSFRIYAFKLNGNFNLNGKGWLNKDIPVSSWDVERNTPAAKYIFKFKFGHLQILAIPILAPGVPINRSEILGHFKVIGYQLNDKFKSKYNVAHEEASIYSFLASTLVFDTYLLFPIHKVKFMNYIDTPIAIDAVDYIFMLHCPVLSLFKLFAHNKTYKLSWPMEDIDNGILDKIFASYDFNLQDADSNSITNLRKFKHELLVSTSKERPNFPMSDYNKDIKEDSLYTEIAEVLRPGVKNIYNVDFIKYPEELRKVIEKQFKTINYNLRNKDLGLINNMIPFSAPPGLMLNCILNDFNQMFDLNQKAVQQFGPINDKYIDIVNSVDAWNFNLVMPLYFYYGDDLVKHISDSTVFFESVIGPYTFKLSDQLKSYIRYSISKWPWKLDHKIIEKMVLAIFQIYFLLLCISENSNKVVVENLLKFELNRYTRESCKQLLQAKLDKLFNSRTSSSTILEEVYVLDDSIVYDPIINKIIGATHSPNIQNKFNLTVLDLIYVNHNLKLYNVTFRKFLSELLNYTDIDTYLRG